jgi:FkbM family methyltransferase
MKGHVMADGLQFPADYYVVDVGMHDGADSEYYARRGFKVVAFEANPLLAEDGQRKFQALGFPIDIRNRAIAKDPGGVTSFYLNHHNLAWSSLDKDLGSRRAAAQEILVQTTDLGQELLPIADRIHMVKIDIEGHDLVALTQLEAAGIRPSFVSVENGGIAFLETFLNMGYSKFKLSNQKYNHFLKVPPGSPHGHALEWTFARHSSGPFGADIPSGWMEGARMREVLLGMEVGKKAMRTPNLWAESIGWFDMHAAL